MNDISNMPTFFGTVIFALEGERVMGLSFDIHLNFHSP